MTKVARFSCTHAHPVQGNEHSLFHIHIVLFFGVEFFTRYSMTTLAFLHMLNNGRREPGKMASGDVRLTHTSFCPKCRKFCKNVLQLKCLHVPIIRVSMAVSTCLNARWRLTAVYTAKSYLDYDLNRVKIEYFCARKHAHLFNSSQSVLFRHCIPRHAVRLLLESWRQIWCMLPSTKFYCEGVSPNGTCLKDFQETVPRGRHNQAPHHKNLNWLLFEEALALFQATFRQQTPKPFYLLPTPVTFQQRIYLTLMTMKRDEEEQINKSSGLLTPSPFFPTLVELNTLIQMILNLNN